MRRLLLRIGLAAALCAGGCSLGPPPYVIVTVEDPLGIAASATAITFGKSFDDMTRADLGGETFPVTFAKTGEDGSVVLLWVEAEDASSEPLGRGRGRLVFSAERPGTAAVVLAPICPPGDSGQRGCALEDASGNTGICLSGECSASICGDAVPDLATGEECDDGNDSNEDFCLNDCTLNVCGDGYQNPLVEACDDGNTASADGCRGDCKKLEVCGDGVLDANEVCDDGNSNPNDTCSNPSPSPALACRPTSWSATVVTGLGEGGEDGSQAPLSSPSGVAQDLQGRRYVAAANQIWRFDPPTTQKPTWTRTLFAGTGIPGSTGDGDLAHRATLNYPYAVAVDSGGNVYVGERWLPGRLRRIGVDGVIESVLGGGADDIGNGGPASALHSIELTGLAIDAYGRVLVATPNLARVVDIIPPNAGVFRWDPQSGFVDLLLGGGTVTMPESGSIASRTVKLAGGGPTPGVAGIAVVGSSVYAVIGLGPYDRVVRVDLEDATCGCPTACDYCASVVMGGGSTWPPAVGTPVTGLRLRQARGIAASADGRLWLSMQPYDFAAGSGEAYVVEAHGGVLTAVWGGPFGLAGDGGPAALARFDSPELLTLAPDGTLLIADSGNSRVRAVDSAGQISTPISNTETIVLASPKPGTSLHQPLSPISDHFGFDFDPSGRIVTPVASGLAVARLAANGDLERVAGTGIVGDSGDGGSALAARFLGVKNAVTGPDGAIYLADGFAHRVRRVTPAGTIEALFGADLPACTKDGTSGPAATRALCSPLGLALDATGALFVSDADAHCIWRLAPVGGRPEPTSTASVVAGICGSPGYFVAQDGGPATSANLAFPNALALHSDGTLYVLDQQGTRIRKVAGGNIYPVAGLVGPCPAGNCLDDGTRADALIFWATGLAVEADGSLLYGDAVAGRRALRRLPATGGLVLPSTGVTTILRGENVSGDGGLVSAAGAGAGSINGLKLAADGALYLASDAWSTTAAIRRVDPSTHVITTVIGDVEPIGDGPIASANLGASRQVAPISDTFFVVADALDGRLRTVDLAAGRVSTIYGYPEGRGPTGTNVASFTQRLHEAWGVAYDGVTNELLLGDREQWSVASVALNPDPDTVASLIDAGTTSVAPAGFAVNDATGELFAADDTHHVVWTVDLRDGSHDIGIAAGHAGAAGFFGDGGPALDGYLNAPEAVAFGPDGSWYIADTGNHRVRRVAPDGVLSTVIGDGDPGAGGGGGAARLFQIDSPHGLSVDGFGNLFIAARREVKVVATGTPGVGASGDDVVYTIYGQPPRDDFPAAVTRCLGDIDVLPSGRVDGVAAHEVLVLDSCLGLLLRLSRTP